MIHSQDKVQILLSTWNGEKWLPELLDSLLQQNNQNWQLLARDDGSRDKSYYLLQKWKQCHPEKIILMRSREHLGSKLSFNRLVKRSNANYLMFCDQDDVWQANKIGLQMDVIKEKEQHHGKVTPILIHSDLEVVDKQLKTKYSSFWKLRGFKLQQPKQKYLVQNIVTGNTCLFNRAAANLAFPLNNKVMEHDRWLALSVAWFGVIQAVHLPLVRYRQHKNNQIGAFAKKYSIRNSVKAWSLQAEYFLHRYKYNLDKKDQHYIASLATLYKKQNWLQRRIVLLKEKIRKDGLMPNIALLLWA